MKQKILVICSHPDDEILGCGGTISRHVSEGDIVKVIYTHEGSSSRFDVNSNSQIIQKKIKFEINQREIMANKVSKMLKFGIVKFYRNQNLVNKNFELLTLVKALLKEINHFKPKVIYTHHEFDLNEDHRYTFKATVNACRPNKSHMVKEIYSFETPSATEWADTFYRNKFRPNFFINIEKFLKNKIDAMKIYGLEMRNYPHTRSKEYITSLSIFRGGAVYLKNAEAFETIRKIK